MIPPAKPMITFNKHTFAHWLFNGKTLLTLYCVVAVVATIHKLLFGPFVHEGIHYESLQNFAIFRNAFFHLIHQQDIYARFINEQWDFYKYSPTFALLMFPMAILPYWAGAITWNLINVLVLYFAVQTIASVNNRAKSYMLWFIVLSMLASLQNAQSNALMAGLMLGAFNAKERGNNALAALCIMLSAYLKLFGIAALLPCMLARGRWKLLGYTALWAILLFAVPLAVVSPKQLMFLYQSWCHLIQTDHSASVGLSFMAWLHSWFGLNISKNQILLVGAFLLMVPLLRFSAYGNTKFRLLLMSSVLLWVVLFNHMAESPTFIIAVSGVALWYFSQPVSITNRILLAMVFIFSCLSPTDIMPHYVRQHFIKPYVLMAVPCIFVWFKIQFDSFRCKAAA